MSVSFSKTEEAILAGVHPDLVKVIRQAAKISKINFRLIQGRRSLAQQKENLKNGVSQTLRSRHLPSRDGLCRAIDLCPVILGKVSYAWPLYYPLAATIKQAARDVAVPVEWGGDWKKFRDGPHWQLPWKLYP